MRLSVTLLSLAVAAQLSAATRRRVVVQPVVDELSISFVAPAAAPTPDGALLDAGRISGRVRQTIGVRIDRRGSGSGRAAVVRAYTDGGDGACMVRIDGLAVGVAPVVIDPQAPIGAVVVHRIAIDVPRDAAEGPLNCAVVWEVSTP